MAWGVLPEQGLNLCAVHWQADFLTTGPPRKSLNNSFHKLIAVLVFLGSWDVPSVSTVVVVQLLSHVQLFVTPWTTAPQASLSFEISWSLLKLMSIELVMPSNHLILCHPLLLLPSIFPSVRSFPPSHFEKLII